MRIMIVKRDLIISIFIIKLLLINYSILFIVNYLLNYYLFPTHVCSVSYQYIISKIEEVTNSRF